MIAGDTPNGRTIDGLSLRANFSWTFVGNVVSAGCQWGMLVVLSKIGTPEMVGQFALGLAVTAPLISAVSAALRAVQVTDARGDYPFSDHFALRLITAFLALLAIVVLVSITGYRPRTALIVLAIAVSKVFEMISDGFYGLLQRHERMDRIAKSMMGKGVLSLLALSAGLLLTHKLLWGVAGMALAMGLRLVTYDLPSGSMMLNPKPQGSRHLPSGSPRDLLAAVRPRWQPGALRRLAIQTLPLVLAAALNSLNTNIPRYFIERQWGERELGFFAAVSYLMVAEGTVLNALAQSASPRLARYYARRDGAAFRGLLVWLVAIAALLGAAGVLVALIGGGPILTVLYRPEYAAYANVFVWAMAAAALSYVAGFLGCGMTAIHYYRIQPVIFVIASAVSVILCILLVPRFGALGGTWALGVSFAVQLVAALLCNIHALSSLGHNTAGYTVIHGAK